MLRKTWLAALCAVTVALAGGATFAEEHGHGRGGDKAHDDDQGHEQDRGHAGKDNGHHGNHGLKKGHTRGVGHHKFDDNDRQVAREWCDQHRHEAPVGFRDTDRLPPAVDARIRVGTVLDADLRRLALPLPTDLLRRLPRPDAGARYVALGGHVGLVDAANRLQDLIRLPF